MIKMKPLPTKEKLEQRFEYREGKLYNKITTGSKSVKGKEAGCLHPNGYLEVRIDGITYKTHRIIWKLVKGKDPVEVIDHINGNKLDNRIENLRDVCQFVNCFNVKAGGVSFRKDRKKWRTQIKFMGKLHHLGCYDTKEEAEEVYNAFKTAYSYVG